MTADPNPWLHLGDPAPKLLADARLALHYAAQPLATAAYALLPTAPDHAHSNLLWSPSRGGFVGRSLPGERRGFLDPATLRIGVVGADGAEHASLALAGLTLEQAFEGLAAALETNASLVLPAYDLPASPLGEGAPFPEPDPACAELGRWFGAAAAALEELASERLAGAELRGWPHHFDLAALWALDPGADPEHGRSIGAGFSPGDGSFDEPYFYVSPWPAPASDALPALEAGGRWHTEGFTSAVLPASALLVAPPGARRARLDAALREAVDACRAALGDGTPA